MIRTRAKWTEDSFYLERLRRKTWRLNAAESEHPARLLCVCFPAWAGRKVLVIHPGEMLMEEMQERGISINALARALRVPPNRVSAIGNGKRGITADTALRLARFFGTSAALWMNLQTEYDLCSADAGKIAREVLPHAS
jgi:addiction module HigA family antidote